MGAAAPERLHFTGDAEADALIASDPLAFLIGFVLDQQVTVQKAFSGPLEIRRRLGHLDAARIAAEDPARLSDVFRERPAIHRYPAAMAERVQGLCAAVAERYGGDAARVWTEAADAADLKRRLRELPGMGQMKVIAVSAVLVKRLGVRPPGWEELVPSFPTLGDVDSDEALHAYQAAKREHKRRLRTGDPG